MRSARSTGRIVGSLLLLQMACGLVLPFVLWRPLIVGFPAFLTGATTNSFQIRTGVFLSFVGSTLTVAIAITAWPIIRQYSETLALCFLVVCAISCTLDAIHNATVMSMLSASREYVTAATSDVAQVTAFGFLAAILRRWVHYTQLLGFGAWIFLFYFSLLGLDMIPRPLAIIGLIGILLQFSGVTLMGFLGYGSVMLLAMPLAPIHVATGLWLIAKGFKEH